LFLYILGLIIVTSRIYFLHICAFIPLEIENGSVASLWRLHRRPQSVLNLQGCKCTNSGFSYSTANCGKHRGLYEYSKICKKLVPIFIFTQRTNFVPKMPSSSGKDFDKNIYFEPIVDYAEQKKRRF